MEENWDFIFVMNAISAILQTHGKQTNLNSISLLLQGEFQRIKYLNINIKITKILEEAMEE